MLWSPRLFPHLDIHQNRGSESRGSRGISRTPTTAGSQLLLAQAPGASFPRAVEGGEGTALHVAIPGSWLL